ncbi:endoglucanase 11-like isoform X1 [Musa acuminata AAA Group]|uniref:endoglucanase 11-like isoform X1 n=1 Tax=Musa acuminata AAA Group TaxID=214697 RepID=UPI0031DCA07E
MAATKQRLGFLVVTCFLIRVHGHPNYADALRKSILFFEGQRSGRLPGDQRITWRSNSGLSDGSAANVDLSGGYYDAGDNVKFGFPMAFTATMLSWSVLEYGKRMGGEVGNTRAAIGWATDYLLKAATQTPGKLYVGVGDPDADHRCWERPEDMDTPRAVYSVSKTNPGSDVAGETAAALAAASLVFRVTDRAYSRRLLAVAKTVMAFAMKYQGKYSDSLGSVVCPFYCSYSGYQDELLWGASWLFRATNDAVYLNYLKSLGANDNTDFFSWDNKFAGARVLLSRRVHVDNNMSFVQFQQQAEDFMCRILPNNPSSTTQYTPGGLMYKQSSANLQYATSISFLLFTYSKYIASSKHSFTCGNLLITASSLRSLAKKQVDYILGENPLKMSYMVGFGARFPQKIHHRAASLPSLATYPGHIGCQAGFQYLDSSSPNPNILTGAVVGGPDQNDAFTDDRKDFSHAEPATYINAPLVGSLAYLVGSYGNG